MMQFFFDEIHDNYDILNMSYDDLAELSKAIDSCNLSQKRFFYNLKKEIDTHLANKKLPKKKQEMIVTSKLLTN